MQGVAWTSSTLISHNYQKELSMVKKLFFCLYLVSSAAIAGANIEVLNKSSLPDKLTSKLINFSAKYPEKEIYPAQFEVTESGTINLHFFGVDYSYSEVSKTKKIKVYKSSYDEIFHIKNNKRGYFFLNGEKYLFKRYKNTNYIVIHKKEFTPEVENDVMDYFCPDTVDGLCEPNLPGGDSDVASVSYVSSVNEISKPSSPHVIRLLLAYTEEAQEYYDNSVSLTIEQHAADMIEDLNDGLQFSDVDDWITIELAGVVRYNNSESYYVSGGRDRKLNYDGILTAAAKTRYMSRPSLNATRLNTKADVVGLVVYDQYNSLCGKAAGIKPGYSGAYFAVQHRCADSSDLTFNHEFGHILGARHNIEDDSSSSPYSFGHGLRNDADSTRTIMSYSCSSYCYRENKFSNPNINFTWGGQPSGTNTYEYVAEALRSSAAEVKGYLN